MLTVIDVFHQQLDFCLVAFYTLFEAMEVTTQDAEERKIGSFKKQIRSLFILIIKCQYQCLLEEGEEI